MARTGISPVTMQGGKLAARAGFEPAHDVAPVLLAIITPSSGLHFITNSAGATCLRGLPLSIYGLPSDLKLVGEGDLHHLAEHIGRWFPAI